MKIRVEPPIPSTTEFSTIPVIRRVLSAHRDGDFERSSILAERMLENARLRAAVGTRLMGIIATQVRWEPIRENPAARRAARDMREDWPFMAPSPMRQQLDEAGLVLGLGLGQRIPFGSPTSGRTLYMLQPYWSGFAHWNQTEKTYRIRALGDSTLDSVPSSWDVRTARNPNQNPWIVHEPFGVNSWRRALMLAAWRPWFGHDLAFRDLNRASEKYGIGALKAKYPHNRKADAGDYISGLRNMGAEGVIPCPEFEPRGEDPGGKFDVEPLEFNGGSGFEVIDKAMNAAAISIAILILGHNLTTEVKGGSYAAADVGDRVRTDIKVGDVTAEWATLLPQLVQPWAWKNHGDPELAPRAIHVTDPPAVNQAMAQTYQQLSLAIRDLKALTNVNVDALCERFQLPMNVVDKAQAQVPAAPQPAPAPPSPPEPQPQEQPA